MGFWMTKMFLFSVLTWPMALMYTMVRWGIRSVIPLRLKGNGKVGKMRNISFLYDRDKATEAILWLLHKHGGTLSKLKLVKLLFWVDKEHLIRYGRPIVGGQYYAMPHGPASSELLNHINEAAHKGFCPFILENNLVLSQTSADKDELSESDIEVLNAINQRYGSFSWWTLRNLSHLLAEYINSWRRKPEGSRRHPIAYEALFRNKKDNDMLDIIRDDQKAWAGLK